MKILVLGYGNPGRADDALGPLLIEELEQRRATLMRSEPALRDAELPRPAAGRAPLRVEQSRPEPPASRAPAREIDLVWSYELAADHAYDLSRHDLTIFVDAARRQAEPVRLRSIRPSRSVTFSTHAMTPASVLALARELYCAKPEVHLLTIRGYRWGLGEGLSPGAAANLAAAVKLVEGILTGGGRDD